MWDCPVHPQHLLPCLQSDISVLSRKMSLLLPVASHLPPSSFSVLSDSSVLAVAVFVCIQHCLETFSTFKASRAEFPSWQHHTEGMESWVTPSCCWPHILLWSSGKCYKQQARLRALFWLTSKQEQSIVIVWGLICLCCAWWNSSGGKWIQINVLCLKEISAASTLCGCWSEEPGFQQCGALSWHTANLSVWSRALIAPPGLAWREEV